MGLIMFYLQEFFQLFEFVFKNRVWVFFLWAKKDWNENKKKKTKKEDKGGEGIK